MFSKKFRNKTQVQYKSLSRHYNDVKSIKMAWVAIEFPFWRMVWHLKYRRLFHMHCRHSKPTVIYFLKIPPKKSLEAFAHEIDAFEFVDMVPMLLLYFFFFINNIESLLHAKQLKYFDRHSKEKRITSISKRNYCKCNRCQADKK